MINIAFAKVLASSDDNRVVLPNLSSTTFKDQLNVAKRVTDENPHLYFEIQHLNEHSLQTIKELNSAISEITQAITQGQEETFVAMMEEGQSYFNKNE
jgi:prephenate dehydrogenase